MILFILNWSFQRYYYTINHHPHSYSPIGTHICIYIHTNTNIYVSKVKEVASVITVSQIP